VRQLEERLAEAQLEILARGRRELELKDEQLASVTIQSQLSSDLEVSCQMTRNFSNLDYKFHK
jgi:hypothetical protein